jgi:hypothetical protein
MSTQHAGYSRTPLAKKLGIVVNSRVLLIHPPIDYLKLLEPLPSGVAFQNTLSATTDIAHLFTDRKGVLAKELESLRKKLRTNAAVWVSWPKKSSKVPTDITEDTIRELALPLGFVDIKVCAVNEIWSGLKLVVRKELRSSSYPPMNTGQRTRNKEKK